MSLLKSLNSMRPANEAMRAEYSFVSDGRLPENLRIPDDLSGEELRQILNDSVKEGLLSAEEVKWRIAKIRRKLSLTVSEENGDDFFRSSPELTELREEFCKSYFKALGRAEETGLAEKNSEGKYFYTADYNGLAEKDFYDENPEFDQKRFCLHAGNFVGQEFKVPELSDLLKWITPGQIKLYQHLKKRNWQPRLQLTPIAYKIATLQEKLSDLNRGLGIKTKKEELLENAKVRENKLIYEPLEIHTNSSGNSLKIFGGLTKSQLIRKYNGWIPEIVTCRRDFPIDTDKVSPKYTSANKLVLNFQEAREIWLSGLGLENNLVMRMDPSGEMKNLDRHTFTMLPETSSIYADIMFLGNADGVIITKVAKKHLPLTYRRSIRIVSR